MSPNLIPFLIVGIFALALFAWNAYRRFRLVALGRPEDRFSNFGKRLWNMLFYAVGQRRVATRSYLFGLNHLIFHGFFWVIIIASLMVLLEGLFPAYISLAYLSTGAYYTLSCIFDIVWALMVVSIIVAMSRRAFFRPGYVLPIKSDAMITLSMIFLMVVSFYGLKAAGVAGGTVAAAGYMPVSGFVASVFMSGIPQQSLPAYANTFWWLFVIALFAFMNYLAVTKHMHIVTAIPNCFFKSLDKVTPQPREEFKKGNAFGVGRVDQFGWKGLFDSLACTDCGRCSDVCPATATGKVLNPRLVIADIKYNLLKNGAALRTGDKVALPLIDEKGEKDGTVPEEAIWDCMTCRACMEVCPVFIEHVPKIVDMRRNLVETHANFPEELLLFFENIEQRSNPWGIAPADRTKWTEDLDVKPFKAGKTEYLFYVGCFGSFDARSRKVTVDIARILNAAGVSWGILGKEEPCCGDSMRQLGNEFIFDRMVRDNVSMFKEKGVRKVITQCPHCYNILKHDYRQYGADFEVIHHTELISDLLDEGRLELKGDAAPGKVVFHDSCYLGRYNDVYSPPRHAVALATGVAPAEMERNRSRSFCCGAGGGRMWLEEDVGERINIARVSEALEEKPQTICVSCPYCLTMFEDGLKDKGADEDVQVLDVAEIVARRVVGE